MTPISLEFRKRFKVALLGLGVFVLAFLFRDHYNNNAVVDTPIRADSRLYTIAAHNIVRNGIFSEELAEEGGNGEHRGFLTPGYPLFLAVVYSTVGNPGNLKPFITRVTFFQAVLGSVAALIVYLIGLSFLPPWAAAAAGALTALSPHLVAFEGYILTETLFMFLLVVGLGVLVAAIKHKGWALWGTSAYILGVGALVRPAVLLFPVCIAALVLLYWRPPRQWLAAGALIGGLFLALLPWQIWSRTQIKVEDRVNTLATSPFALGIYPDFIHRDPQYRGYPYREDPLYPEISVSVRRALETLGERARAEPWKYLRWYLVGKPVSFWSRNILAGQGGADVYPMITSPYETNSLYRTSYRIMQWLHPFLAVLATLGLFVLIIVRLRRDQGFSESTMILMVIGGLLAYFTLVHMVFSPLPRYSVPVRPFMYLGALATLVSISRQCARTLRARGYLPRTKPPELVPESELPTIQKAVARNEQCPKY